MIGMDGGAAPRLELGPGMTGLPALPKGISPYPSPRDESTDGSFLPPRFWKPRSLGTVSVVVAVAPESGRKRRKKPAPAKGIAALDLCVIEPPPGPIPVEVP